MKRVTNRSKPLCLCHLVSPKLKRKLRKMKPPRRSNAVRKIYKLKGDEEDEYRSCVDVFVKVLDRHCEMYDEDGEREEDENDCKNSGYSYKILRQRCPVCDWDMAVFRLHPKKSAFSSIPDNELNRLPVPELYVYRVSDLLDDNGVIESGG